LRKMAPSPALRARAQCKAGKSGSPIDPNMNERILNRFALLKKKDRLAHAYLLTGAPNAGKTRTAVAIAKLLNCEGEKGDSAFFLEKDEKGRCPHYCGQCPSCKKIDSGNHPDFHRIESPEGESLKIEQIRDVISQVKFRPFSGKYKIFIIRDVERLTTEAANALLKTLEEPSASSLLLLTTSSAENVLETIRSRCHMVNFFSSSNEELEVSLKGRYNAASTSPEELHFLAYMAEGCPGKAQRLADDKVPSRKNTYIDQFLLSAHSDEFINTIAADKDRLKEFLRIVMAWFRDAILLKAHGDHKRLIHADRVDDLEDFAVRFTVNDLGILYRETVNAYKMVVDNLNVKLPLLILKEQLWGN